MTENMLKEKEYADKEIH